MNDMSSKTLIIIATIAIQSRLTKLLVHAGLFIINSSCQPIINDVQTSHHVLVVL